MEALPKEFLKRMEDMLGEEFPKLLQAYSRPCHRGIRLNTLKCSRETLLRAMGGSLEPGPFSPLSYYLPGRIEKPGAMPLHHAGAFYVQEPSAACAAQLLGARPGERVLDLCAAPGGKSTQIAAAMEGKGLLWANEVVRGRAKVLISNLERMGVSNAVASSCHPETLCQRLEGFFHRVLVDAPCSGEGMFRRDEKAIADWSGEHVASCARRQLAILRSAAQAVMENGVLVYSTCTFAPEENEGVISEFLKERPDFVLEEPEADFGRPGIGMPQARRIYPMDGGEGHFAVRLRRLSQSRCGAGEYEPRRLPAEKAAGELYGEIFLKPFSGALGMTGDTLFILPEGMPELSGLGVLRAGVPLGELKAKRIEPAHGLWMASRPGQLRQVLELTGDSPEIMAFLRGEELCAQGSGYVGVAVEGIITGFGKCSQGRLKNHYPKGLRRVTPGA